MAREKFVLAELDDTQYRQKQTEERILAKEKIRDLVESLKKTTINKIKKGGQKEKFTENQSERTYLGMIFDVLCKIGVMVKPKQRVVKLSRNQFAKYLELCRTEFSKGSTYYIRYGTREGRSNLNCYPDLIERLDLIEDELEIEILNILEKN